MKNIIKVCLFTLFLSGCTNKEKKYNLETITLTSKKNMNHNSVIRIDLIQVFHEDLWKKISNMDAKEYFTSKSDLNIEHHAQMRTWAFEPLPQNKIRSFAINCWHQSCFGAIMFFSYASKNKHMLIIPQREKHISIRLGDNDVESIIYNTSKPYTKIISAEMEKTHEQQI